MTAGRKTAGCPHGRGDHFECGECMFGEVEAGRGATVEVPLDALRYVVDEMIEVHPYCSRPECPWEKVRKAVEEYDGG